MDKTDEDLSALFAAIRQLLTAPSSTEEREMGFHVREDEPVRYGKPRKSK